MLFFFLKFYNGRGWRRICQTNAIFQTTWSIILHPFSKLQNDCTNSIPKLQAHIGAFEIKMMQISPKEDLGRQTSDHYLLLLLSAAPP